MVFPRSVVNPKIALVKSIFREAQAAIRICLYCTRSLNCSSENGLNRMRTEMYVDTFVLRVILSTCLLHERFKVG